MSKIGDRVGAILSAEGSTVRLLGYGVYEGDFIPEEGIGGHGDMIREAGIKNPRIKLDSGKTVYGCECWWGPEATIKAKVSVYEHQKEADIDEVRKGQV